MSNIHIKPYGDIELHVHWSVNQGEPRTYDHPGEAKHAEIDKIFVVAKKFNINFNRDLNGNPPEDEDGNEVDEMVVVDITSMIYASPYLTEFEQHIREEIQEKYEI